MGWDVYKHTQTKRTHIFHSRLLDHALSRVHLYTSPSPTTCPRFLARIRLTPRQRSSDVESTPYILGGGGVIQRLNPNQAGVGRRFLYFVFFTVFLYSSPRECHASSTLLIRTAEHDTSTLCEVFNSENTSRERSIHPEEVRYIYSPRYSARGGCTHRVRVSVFDTLF